MGIVSAELHFGEAVSLKDKRAYMHRIRDRLTHRHGAAFSEIGYQDLWQRSAIVAAVAASDLSVLESRMAAVVGFLDSQEWVLASVDQEVVEIDD